MEMISWDFLWLFLLNLGASFIGATTGGSSLITIPVMISMGIPPHSAIANARLASTASMAASIGPFHREGKIDYRLASTISICGIVGAIVGAKTLILIPEEVLRKCIGGITLALFLFTLLKNSFEPSDTPLSKKRVFFGYVCFFFVGLWGGFFGGQAFLATYLFGLMFNKSITESIGTRKVTGLAISLTALIFYGFHGIIDWGISIALLVGSYASAALGTRYALKKGERWIKTVFSIATILFSLKLLFF